MVVTEEMRKSVMDSIEASNNGPKKKLPIVGKNEEVKKKTPQEKKQTIPQTSFYMDENMIAEQVTYEEEGKECQGFALWNRNQCQPELEESNCYTITNSYAGYLPMLNEAVKKKLVIFPSGLTRYDTIQELLKELKEHIHKWLDVSPTFEKISSYAILVTWIYDTQSTTPYIRALGDSGTGKSRFLDVIGGICYKPMMISGAITPAPIYRLIETFKGTLVIDEADMKDTDYTSEIITILNCGFEKRRTVVRCNKDKNNELQTFDTFCPKVIATRQSYADKALESRCITEVMKETIRVDIPVILPQDFYDEQDKLRRKLLCFRMRQLSKISTKADTTQDASFERLVEPRLRQSTASIFVALKDYPEELDGFKAFLKGYSNDLRKERADSFDGMIINFLIELFEKNNDAEVSSKDVASYLEVERGLKKVSAQTVGRHLKSLGFKIKVSRDSDGKPARLVVFDGGLLGCLKRKYYDQDLVTDVTAVSQKGGSGTLFAFQGSHNNNIIKNTSPSPYGSVTSVTSVTCEGNVTDIRNKNSIRNNKFEDFPVAHYPCVSCGNRESKLVQGKYYCKACFHCEFEATDEEEV